MSCSRTRRGSRRVGIVGLAGWGILAAAGTAAGQDGDLLAACREYLAAQRSDLAGLESWPDRAERLLETGEPVAARALLPEPPIADRAARRVAVRVLLDVREYDRLAPHLPALDRADVADRELLYEWLFITDDLPTVEAWTTEQLDRDSRSVPDLLAAGRLRRALMDYDGAERHFQEAVGGATREKHRRAALRGLAGLAYKRGDFDGSLELLRQALEEPALDPKLLDDLSDTLIRLGRTDEAIAARELAVEMAPYDESAHYMLGNGYARKNYTQLYEAYPDRFADAAGRRAMAQADSLLQAGRADEARAAYEALSHSHPQWADVLVRRGSLDFSEGRYRDARRRFEESLVACPEYGRAHNGLAKALEAERLAVEIHRADYEETFAATAQPPVAGIEEFVSNWNSLSARHQKQVALAVAPWEAYLPVLVAGGLTYYIKPLYELLSETPGQRTLRDLRISYDSRLWDDVRGCGGYHTVTGVEDVERSILGRYNTVLHELTHQVHSVLPTETDRRIQELYRETKERHEETGDAFLSRYAGGSVWEYFAEGANALASPRRDDYDTREVVRERLERMDPALAALVRELEEEPDLEPCYPVAYSARGDKALEDDRTDVAIVSYEEALKLNPNEATAISALVYALQLAGENDRALARAEEGVARNPGDGDLVTARAGAQWHAGRGLAVALKGLGIARETVREEDRYRVDLQMGNLHWVAGDAEAALAAFDRVLEYQADNPEGLWGRAKALALAERWDEAWPMYEEAVRSRTGIVPLRLDYGRDLLRAGRLAEGTEQIEAAMLLDPEEPTVRAMRAWVQLETGDAEAAYETSAAALAAYPWCDLARLIQGKAAAAMGREEEAAALLTPIRKRIEAGAPPRYVYREEWGRHDEVGTLPAVERVLLTGLPQAR